MQEQKFDKCTLNTLQEIQDFCEDVSQYIYCLQMKFEEVMFSQVFVCPHGGLCPRGSLSRGLC